MKTIQDMYNKVRMKECEETEVFTVKADQGAWYLIMDKLTYSVQGKAP